MNDGMRPAAGVRLYYVDDAGVLFCEPRQELHLLNPTATLIWSLLEEGSDEAAIATQLRTGGLDDGQSTQFVTAALADWREKGFLGDGIERAGERDVKPASQVSQLPPPRATSHVQHERRYRLLGSCLSIGFSSDAQLGIVHPVLEHLAVDEAANESTAGIEIVEERDRLLVYRDRELFSQCPAIDGLAPIVKSAVWATAVRDHRFFLNIHAGVVSDGTRCLVLPAPPGSGKSTLTAALVHAGYEYFSDEVALLEDATLGVFPLPLALCVKDSGVDALADRYPRLRSLPIHRRGDGKRVVYMPPPADRRPTGDAARPVAALVFPRFVPGAVTALTSVPAAEVLQRLTGQCVGVSERLDFDRVERLVQWVLSLPCHALTYGSLDQALAAVQSLFPPRG